MRIVGGRLRGRALAGPKSPGTRPTSDRLREAVFNIIAHGIEDFDLDGARVLDLFAGTGALGLEALSRGARFALLVDDSADARGVIRRNADDLGLAGQVKVWRRDAARLGPCAPMAPFDLAFADPPYRKGLAGKALASLAEGGWLAPGALVVIEEAAGTEIAVPAGMETADRRVYGDTQVLFLRAAGALA